MAHCFWVILQRGDFKILLTRTNIFFLEFLIIYKIQTIAYHIHHKQKMIPITYGSLRREILDPRSLAQLDTIINWILETLHSYYHQGWRSLGVTNSNSTESLPMGLPNRKTRDPCSRWEVRISKWCNLVFPFDGHSSMCTSSIIIRSSPSLKMIILSVKVVVLARCGSIVYVNQVEQKGQSVKWSQRTSMEKTHGQMWKDKKKLNKKSQRKKPNIME